MKNKIKKFENNIINHISGSSQMQNSTTGFSMIEVLVAITILILALVGPLTLAYQSLSSSKNIKNQTTAVFLAQDALELVKNLRDGNDLNDITWNSSIEQCTAGCTADSAAGSVNLCSGNCPILRFDEATGLYGHNLSWDPTIFTRIMTFTAINDNEAEISVDVSWGSGLQARTITITDNIFDWHE